MSARCLPIQRAFPPYRKRLREERRTTAQTVSKNRGRIETRMLTVCDVSAIQPGDLYCSDWPGLKQILKLQREVREGDRVTSTVSYAITSVPPGAYTAAQWLQIWRNHWGIENRCFYIRDVTLREDVSRLRTGEAPRNMATFRNAALGLLRGLGLENVAHTLREHALDLPKLARRLGLDRLKQAKKFFSRYPV
jgi:hypothetical protein